MPDPYNKPTPRELIDRVDHIKAKRVVEDPHVGKRVPVDELLPAELDMWIEDYPALDQPSAWAEVMARDEEEGQRLILQQMANDRWASEARLLDWLQAGKPVRLASAYAKAPPGVEWKARAGAQAVWS